MNIIMPKMGESVTEGTIIKWHKKVGDKVKRDEILFEITTDKVDTEIPSSVDGILEEILVKENETVAVDTVVAKVNSPSEKNEKADKPNEVKTELKKSEPDENVDGEIYEITMPKMGESVMEGTIIKWHKSIGDEIKKDEVLFEITTDKVDTEVPSSEAGFLTEILVKEQETVEVGVVVAKISSVKGAKAKTVSMKQVQEEKSVEVTYQEKSEVNGKQTSSRFYSPLVMNIAKKENVSFDELEKIQGTGIDNRVSKKDILTYIESRGTGKKEVVSKTATKEYKRDYIEPKGKIVGDTEIIPMDNIRQKIMQHMVNSRDTSVHVNALIEVDMSKIHQYIQLHKDAFYKREGIKLTFMPFIAYACTKALKEYPLMNSAIDGNSILKKRFINLGIAVAVEPNGLIVPNIKNADEKNITGLAKSIYDIAIRSRNKKLVPDDISNGTFTITNYGLFGTIFGTPIINQPEVAILGVGAVQKKPVVVELDGFDTIAIKPMTYLTLAHDHRLIDGMLGGLFLKFVKDQLENFDVSAV